MKNGVFRAAHISADSIDRVAMFQRAKEHRERRIPAGLHVKDKVLDGVSIDVDGPLIVVLSTRVHFGEKHVYRGLENFGALRRRADKFRNKSDLL
jgi:hypothetical protein